MPKLNTGTDVFTLGTSVKITTVLDVATPTSVKITILDPTDVTKADEVSMTKSADYVYSYVYQSVDTDTEGIYVITIEAIANSKTAISQYYFTLEAQE